ncbi:MAG: putative alpha/beta superfamily hydrolase [Limisphaerales bacterium]
MVPYAEREFVPFKHRVLFGYSLGGIFMIQALMEEPELFHFINVEVLEYLASEY